MTPEELLLFDGSLDSGWYGLLLRVARADSVHVIARQHGFLGTYRRSLQTGRWHTAPEQIHLWGTRT